MADRIERRACERFVVPGAVVNCREEGLFSGKDIEETLPVFDISRGGVRFLSNSSLKIDSRVTVRIIIPGNEAPLVLKGFVRWRSINPGKSYKYQVGIQFAPYGKEKGDNDYGILESIIALEKRLLKGAD